MKKDPKVYVINKKGEEEELLKSSSLLKKIGFSTTWLYRNLCDGLPRYYESPPRYLFSEVDEWLRSKKPKIKIDR